MIEMFAQSYTPQPGTQAPDGDSAWREAVMNALREGQKVSPRGMETVEMLHGNLVSVDMARPVATSPLAFRRDLPGHRDPFRFMAAEALWIVDGQNDLASLEKHAPTYARFSDDGMTLAGAYGPKIAAQRDWVVAQLMKDRDTRQAVLTIWERNPAPSKDIPCTVAMSFSVRRGRLHQHVFMRSSDCWMGLPFDIFSFACVGLHVACCHNEKSTPENRVLPGTLTVNATSSHVYMRDVENVQKVLATDPPGPVDPVPEEWILAGDAGWANVHASLVGVRDQIEVVPKWKVTP